MIITQNFKNKAQKAKKAGYVSVYSVGGGYKDTVYISEWEIDWLLKQPINSSVRAFKAVGGDRWRGHMNTRHLEGNEIQYSQLMAMY